MMEAGLMVGQAVHQEITNNDLNDSIRAMHRTLAHFTHNDSEKETFHPNIYLDEWTDTGPEVSQDSVTMKLNVSTPALIESIVWSIPAANGTLQVGGRNIPLTSNNGSWTGLKMVVYPEDIIVLTSTTAGQIYIELMGKVFKDSSRWNRV